MRATFAWSPSETMALLPSFRFVLGPFDVRMCRVFVWPRTILPVPVFLKRLAAPEWVFNLGIVFSIWTGSRDPAGRVSCTQRFPCMFEALTSIAQRGLHVILWWEPDPGVS